MRSALPVFAVLLLTFFHTSLAQAQSSSTTTAQAAYDAAAGRFVRINVSQSFRQPLTRSTRFGTAMNFQTSVLVPDGGEALVAGNSTVSEGSREAGAPGFGKLPGLDRGFRNLASGRTVRTSRATVRVRVIRMSEEEERQTGVRP